MTNLEFIRSAARETNPDRYAAALLAPATTRGDLIIVAAYLGDTARIPLTVADPMLVEIRLQWWRDTLSAGAQGGLSGNPIADDMVRTISKHSLELSDVLAPLEARSFEVNGDDSSFDAYINDAEAAPARLAARILEQQTPEPGAGATRPYALVRLALRLPLLLAKGHWPVPAHYSGGRDPRPFTEDEARDTVRETTAALVSEALQSPRNDRLSGATLPSALTRSYAKALQSPSRDPLTQPADIAPLTRLSRLWWAARVG